MKQPSLIERILGHLSRFQGDFAGENDIITNLPEQGEPGTEIGRKKFHSLCVLCRYRDLLSG